jgi:hypothetical protein
MSCVGTAMMPAGEGRHGAEPATERSMFP